MAEPKPEPEPDKTAVAPPAKPRATRRQRSVTGRVLITLLDAVVILALVLIAALLLLSGRSLPAPDWVTERVQTRLAAAVAPGEAVLDGIAIVFDKIGPVEVRVDGLSLRNPGGAEIAAVPELAVRLDRRALWQGQIRPEGLSLDGAVLRLRRDRAGRLELGFGETQPDVAVASVADALAALQAAFDRPGLAWIDRMEARGVTLVYADERAGRAWRVEDGTVVVEQSDDAIALSVSLELAEDAGDAAPRVALRLTAGREGGGAVLSALVERVPAADIAAQSPALAFLAPLQAPVSGALIANLGRGEALGPINGTLEIGAGTVRPSAEAAALPIDSARAYFGYLPEQSRLRFDTMEIRSPALTFAASGHVLLEGPVGAMPDAFVGQLQLQELRVAADGIMADPLAFSDGALDVKVVADPFEARIGQLSLVAAPAGPDRDAVRIHAEGRVSATAEGWATALDVELPVMQPDDLLALWPLEAIPMTRKYLVANLQEGRVRHARAAVRRDPDGDVRSSLSFEFEQTRMRPLPTLPPIENASGRGTINDKTFALTLEQGALEAPEGGTFDLSGTTLRIADISVKPAQAQILWQSESSVQAALSVLDQPPFDIMKKAGRPVNIADGALAMNGQIAFPLARKIGVNDVTFALEGGVTDMSSDVLVPGRLLTSTRMGVVATNEGLDITGAASIDGVPVTARWMQTFGPEAPPPRIEGSVQVSSDGLTRLGITLPEGLVGGSGTADVAIVLPKDAPPELELTSDLRGVTLSVPTLGWRKPAAPAGRLALSARLGTPPLVERLELEAAGLSLEGDITLQAGGGLQRARFTRLAVDNWLDAPVTLEGRGVGRPPAVRVGGGRMDLRSAGFGSSGGGGGGGSGGGGPLSVQLDRLVVHKDVTLTGFRGDFTTGGGLQGNFTARINGRSEVTGRLTRAGGGRSAVRLDAANAGAALAAADIFQEARGGTLAVGLTPRGGAGSYDGQLLVQNVRVTAAPGLAALLNTISVVGLLDQMNGPGLLLSDIRARFRVTPGAVEVTQASATGPSIGLTIEGVYDMARDRINMQGVFSPAYALNSIGQVLTRRGEGLVGLTYTLTGRAGQPRLQINPLSALTPGMFREIFRAPPARLRE